MFAVLFGAIVLQLLASMGTFGALVAQNLFTNSAAGWYIRLDWTAVYTYAVSILSVIVSFCLAIAGLTRGASGNRGCGFLFNSFGIFVIAFIFSILWVVIAGFAYRDPLPLQYPCDIYRHLRYSLEMLGMASGKSLVEEGGLLVGICQSSKAFLVLAGIGLGLWIFILVSSCAAIATGGSKSSKQSTSGSSKKSVSSIRSALSRLRRHGINTQQLPMPATYARAPESGQIARTPSRLAYPAQAASADQPTSLPLNTRYIDRRQATYVRPRPVANSHTKPFQSTTYQCPPSCAYHGNSDNLQVNDQPAQPLRNDNSTVLRTGPEVQAASGLNDAFVTDGYSRDISPRPDQPRSSTKQSPANHPIDDDSREMGHDNNEDVEHGVVYEHEDGNGYSVRYSPDDGHEYIHHHPPLSHEHNSQPSRRQRLRQIFTRDTSDNT
ncbi:hypothetical protein BX667DRAFT_499362 [Coemansia mojavensis]|nr:hypothetical protein BX667DRAFT_499362 [Coemansia mojavensis]